MSVNSLFIYPNPILSVSNKDNGAVLKNCLLFFPSDNAPFAN